MFELLVAKIKARLWGDSRAETAKYAILGSTGRRGGDRPVMPYKHDLGIDELGVNILDENKFRQITNKFILML